MRLIVGFPPQRTRFEPGSGHVGFVGDKLAVGQVFSEYFSFPCHSSSSVAGTRGQRVTNVASGFSLAPPQEKMNHYHSLHIITTICFADGGCHVVSVKDPYGRILGFPDQSSTFFFQVAPQLYWRGWVDPVPDLLLFRKSGCAGNRTRTSGSVARNSDQRTTEAVV
jgi:hypothetical protein